MKSIAVDSSSIILLQKVRLLQSVLDNYSIVIAESVYRELTLVNKSGVAELVQLLSSKVMQLRGSNSQYPRMDIGERDTIEVYRQRYSDFILLDDKKAAIYCRKNRLPFVNSLLVPRIFYAAGILGVEECWLKFRGLVKAGYYSDKIVARAKDMSEASLLVFSP